MAEPRAIFFGTPEFAVPCLSALCEVANVVHVITQPDRPSGRGMQLTPPPVKVLAEARGIPVAQPKAIRKPELAEWLRSLEADLAIVVAYGRILPLPVLQAPRLGCLNVHGSLLPKYRGAAPIQRAVIGGEQTTGVCLMQMDEGMDTGPLLACTETAIGPEETAGELFTRLSAMGADLLRSELPRFLRGELAPKTQDHAAATLAPMLTKDDGKMAWERSAHDLHNLVRGTQPWPGAHAFLQGQRLKLHRTRVLLGEGEAATPGTIVRADRHGIEVACGRGVLVIETLQPEGKRRMTAEQFLAGAHLPQGARFVP